jgi:Na+-translocating membrane potential-generating system (MpsC)
MTGGRLPQGLAAELTKSLASVWTQYTGKAPRVARTEIRGNVVTCVFVDAVSDYNRSMTASQTPGTAQAAGQLTSAAYKRAAVAAVGRLTRQRVTSFISSHDRDTDVATEVFTLETSRGRGAPSLRHRRLGQDLPPFSARHRGSATVGS